MRDTAAWCIGRVCDTCEEVVTRQEILAPMLPALSTSLHQEPRVAANVCWVILPFLGELYYSSHFNSLVIVYNITCERKI